MPENTPIQTSQEDAEQILMNWQAPVHPTFDRGKQWYVVGGGIVIACALYGIFTGAWSFVIVILLCAAMYVLVRGHQFPTEKAVISNKGVDIAGSFMRWDDVEGFWLMKTPTYTELHVTPRNTRQRELVIQTGDLQIETVRRTMAEHTTELTEKSERLLDAFIRICKL